MNVSAKTVTPVQITHRNSGLWLAERQWEMFCRPMTSCKAMTKILYGNSEKRFFECEKWLQETASGTLIFRANFFMLALLTSNHTVFLVLFEINLQLWVFQKPHSCKLISNWTRNLMITYTKSNLGTIFQVM